MSALDELLDKIRQANTNISNRLGSLNDHITQIVEAGKEILRKIQSGHLQPGQIAQIRDRIEALRVKTMSNIDSRNGRIAEIQRIFDELLAVSPTAAQPVAPVAQPVAPTNVSGLEMALASFQPDTRDKILGYATPIADAFQENPIAMQTIKELFEAFQRGDLDAPRFIHYLRRFAILLNITGTNLPSEANYAKGFKALTNVLNAKTGYKVSVEQPLPQLTNGKDYTTIQSAVQGMIPNVNIPQLVSANNIARSDVELFYILQMVIRFIEGQLQVANQGKLANQSQGPSANNGNLANKAEAKQVEANINAIPDTIFVLKNENGQNQLNKITYGINSLKAYLNKDTTNHINRGLLSYINDKYTFTDESVIKSHVSGMKQIHKPVLKFILYLANTTVEEFNRRIKEKLTDLYPGSLIHEKQDIGARTGILRSVIGPTTNLNTYIKSQNKSEQVNAQQGGRRSCGCGIKGGRRTLRRRRTRTRKTRR